MRTTDDSLDMASGDYRLDDQVGFKLRLAYQRHALVFAGLIPDGLTPTQWAVLARLAEGGPLSQANLGRLTAMDAATVKGVVDRLVGRSLVAAEADPDDGRRLKLALTAAGSALVRRATPAAAAISERTLEPLSPAERRALLDLLDRLC